MHSDSDDEDRALRQALRMRSRGEAFAVFRFVLGVAVLAFVCSKAFETIPTATVFFAVLGGGGLVTHLRTGLRLAELESLLFLVKATHRE